MEDYIRGLLCGYLTVQTGARNDPAKRRHMFAVLSDSRMDFYATDPRPEFKEKIASTYIFKPGITQVNYYAELYPRAPPHSLSLTTDKATDVYIAESDREAKLWHEHLTERLEALKSMVCGTLLLRKELSPEQHLKRIAFKTKYRWKARYVELGRSSLQFCKTSERRTKSMKQFALSATSFVGEEDVAYLKRMRLFASYSIPVDPGARVLRQLERAQRSAPDTLLAPTKNSYGVNIFDATRCAGVSIYYPFIVATGEAYLLLCAATDRSREEWVTAIRMRIISLKYRHNHSKEAASSAALPKIQGFVDAMPKPGGSWKRRWVELDNGILRVKSSERRLGAIVETRLIPTCQVTPTLTKANAFVVSNLGNEIALAPGGMRESSNWMRIIAESAKAANRAQYCRAFDADIQQLLRCSVVYTLVVTQGDSAGLVVEKANKRVIVVSHSSMSLELDKDASISSFSLLSFVWRHRQQPRQSVTEELILQSDLPLGDGGAADEEHQTHAAGGDDDQQQQLPIPPGSVLVGVQHFGMLYDSFENMWHKIRQKKLARSGDDTDSQQLNQPMRLLFRAPIEKEGVARVKYRAGDDWALARCRLTKGTFSISCVHGDHEMLALPLRCCLVELISDENCPNCIKISCVTPAPSANDLAAVWAADTTRLSAYVFMKVELDADLFMWFEFLSLEISVARDGPTFPLSVMSIKKAAKVLLTKKTPKSELPSTAGYAHDQRAAFRKCRVIGDRLNDIELDALESERAVLQSGEFEEFCSICGVRSANVSKRISVSANNADAILEERRAAPTHSRIPVLQSDAKASAALTDDEVRSFFQQISITNGGHVGFAELAMVLARLTTHLRLSNVTEKSRRSVGNLLGSDFCSAVHALAVAGANDGGLAVPFEAFESVVKRIQHPEVMELVRRFARSEIHIL